MSKIKIGIIVADADEYRPFAEAVSSFGAESYDYFGKSGVLFDLYEARVVCVNCGIGKVNATAAAMHLVDIGCNKILNFGLSGGISGVRRGEIVLPQKFIEHDFDLTTIGYKPCEKPGQNYIYSADEVLSSVMLSVLGDAARGTAVCGDRFICNDADRSFLHTTFDATSCDMETAAIASVCDMCSLPFACIRRISDDAGDDALSSYRDMNINDGQTLSDIFICCLKEVCKIKEK